VALAVATAVPSLHADVKTREKTTFELGGFLGGVVRVFGGGRAAREGIESTVALKGSRKATTSDTTGQIVDLTEERVYTLDMRRREYRVRTFAELRAEFEKARAEAEKQAASAKPEDKEQIDQAARQLEFDVDVKETGQRRNTAGHDTREVVVTITGREKGRTLEEGGGFVMTNTLWLAPRIAALDEQLAFEMKYVQAVYGQAFVGDMQQMAGMLALYPSFVTMASQLQDEQRKLDGTPLATTMVFESVRSAEQMQAAQSEQQSSGGGGIGGMLGRRLMGNRGAPEPRSMVLRTTSEMLSIDTTVADADVAIPANFRERK
jgi:hypothetical protein